MSKFAPINEQMDLILRGTEEIIPVEELDILEIWPHTHGKKKVKEETLW